MVIMPCGLGKCGPSTPDSDGAAQHDSDSPLLSVEPSDADATGRQTVQRRRRAWLGCAAAVTTRRGARLVSVARYLLARDRGGTKVGGSAYDPRTFS